MNDSQKKKPMMFHTSAKIHLVKRLFDGYLTKEELQEKQYEGRFWDISNGILFILIDEDTLVVIYIDGDVRTYGRYALPNSLVGAHYE